MMAKFDLDDHLGYSGRRAKKWRRLLLAIICPMALHLSNFAKYNLQSLASFRIVSCANMQEFAASSSLKCNPDRPLYDTWLN